MSKRDPDYYEADEVVKQYLFFHYAKNEDVCPFELSIPGRADFLPRVLEGLLDLERIPPKAVGLDMGCGVGRGAFELSRLCQSILAVDLSSSFIASAKRLQQEGKLLIQVRKQGEQYFNYLIYPPTASHPDRISFEVGDALSYPLAVNAYSIVLLANLIDRVAKPISCIRRAAAAVAAEGQLIIVSPYTWDARFTSKPEWLGRPVTPQEQAETPLEAIANILGPKFVLQKRIDIPFLIREHERKYQWSIAEGSCWVKELV